MVDHLKESAAQESDSAFTDSLRSLAANTGFGEITDAADKINQLETTLAEAERDVERLTWLSSWIDSNTSGLEIYPIGPDKEYGEDDNTVVNVRAYSLADKTWPGCKTLREAIDAARLHQEGK